MPRWVVIDELYVSIYVARGLGDKRCAVIRRTLLGARFQTALRRAVQGILERQPQLAGLRVAITR